MTFTLIRVFPVHILATHGFDVRSFGKFWVYLTEVNMLLIKTTSKMNIHKTKICGEGLRSQRKRPSNWTLFDKIRALYTGPANYRESKNF